MGGNTGNLRFKNICVAEGKHYEISDDFRVSFQEECALVEKGFPRPVLQMEIEAAIPWVLEEENPYL